MTQSRAKAESQRRRARPAVLLALALLSGCAGETDPAAAAALELFELAQGADPGPEVLAVRFDPPPGDERDQALLLDALASLAALPVPHVVGVERPPGEPEDAFVDLESTLAGGGLARFTVRLAAGEDGLWRVGWFQGPGVAWPPRGRVRNEGLTSSAIPKAPR